MAMGVAFFSRAMILPVAILRYQIVHFAVFDHFGLKLNPDKLMTEKRPKYEILSIKLEFRRKWI